MEDPPLAGGPFFDALGPGIVELSPAVRMHLVPAAGARRYEGFLRRIWRRGIAGRIASRLLHLRGEERGIFRLENRLVPDSSIGSVGPAMTWHGTHVVNGKPVDRVGLMSWKPSDRVLVDRIGPGGWLFGGAVTREWQESDGRIALRLGLHHPLFGDYAGYEAVFAPVEAS